MKNKQNFKKGKPLSNPRLRCSECNFESTGANELRTISNTKSDKTIEVIIRSCKCGAILSIPKEADRLIKKMTLDKR